jgi:hypothetical protein
MIMLPHIIIESFLAATDFQFRYDTSLGQYLKISIDRGKADTGHTLLNPIMQFIGREMLPALAQLPEDNLTLVGHSKLHGSVLFDNDYYL